MAAATTVDIEGRQLKLSNLDKVLYPEVGFTKGEVIAYYQRISPTLLPHLASRPLTLKRYPNGVEGEFFYEKRCPSHRPEWVQTIPIHSSRNKGVVPYCVVDSLATLVWVANLASLELHTSLSHGDEILRPRMLVFDLDPGPPADIVQCCEVALRLQALFDRMGLVSIAKTSGSKGLQVYVPLNTPDVRYDNGTKDFALAVAQSFEQRLPDQVVSSMKKDLRPGKVLIDWSQNDEHKTTVNVYSLRAKPRPTVSTPVTWEEVEACAEAADASMLVFTADDVIERVGRMGDLFAPAVELEQELPALSP
ncbi:MAG TPA: non-homologous end-joining DNA ligase [Acidimicrobiales bacterium]|nr:non-homologous end-joining DNA ligase [Acidimicrobiales bacterium]